MTHYCDYFDEERFNCLPSEVDGQPIHGLGCALWQPRVKKEVVAPTGNPYPPHDSAYELTLTTTEDNPYLLRETVNKIMASAMFEIISYSACIELTQAGLPHVHAILYSKKKYLDASKIKAPKGPIKFPYRYELKRVRNINNYLNYIQKENGNKLIEDYCARKGIPQFWDGVSQI